MGRYTLALMGESPLCRYFDDGSPLLDMVNGIQNSN